MKFFIYVFVLMSMTLAANEVEDKLSLPKTIKLGLSEDMHVIQSNMNTLLDSMSRAQWNKMYESATELKNNFIMKQKLSIKEQKLLRNTVPKGYIEEDKKFHYWAGVIATGAKRKSGEIVSKGYAGLVNTCMTCHAKYAPYMFENFKEYTPPKTEEKKIYKHPDDWR